MPTLATGTWVNRPRRAARPGSRRPEGRDGNRPRVPRAASSGFTLVEIMIVAFIIGLVAAAAVITFGGERRDAELEREAERLDALLDYAREQAELQTRDFGFRVNRLNYQFVVFDVLRNEWRVAHEDEALRERALQEGLLPSLVIEGRPVVLEQRWPKIDDFKPQIMIFGNGDLTSFEFALTREGTDNRAVIRSDEQGAIRLQLPDEEQARTALERALPQPTP
jgi:general secretion pathway protein H